jgi:hypothetical protein
MRREARLVGIGHPFAHHLDEREIFLRDRVTDGIRNVDRGGAGLDGGLDAAAEKVMLGAGAVLAAPLDIVGEVAGAGDRRYHHLVHGLRLQLQLPLHVDRRGRQEGVDAPALGRLDCFAGAIDVLLAGAREAAHHRVLGALGDLLDGGEVALRGDREAGLDDVDPHGIEQLGDLELLFMRHGGAGRLLAVAQGGVENDDAILLGWCWRGHGKGPSDGSRPSKALGLRSLGSVVPVNPLSAQAQMPSRRSGADKEQEPAANEGSAGQGQVGPPVGRADIASRRHRFRPCDGSKAHRHYVRRELRKRVNPPLTPAANQAGSSGNPAPSASRRVSDPCAVHRQATPPAPCAFP